MANFKKEAVYPLVTETGFPVISYCTGFIFKLLKGLK